MSAAENSHLKTDFEIITGVLEKSGIPLIVHARLGGDGVERRYVFCKKYAGYRVDGQNMESASLDALIKGGLSYFAFENGKLALH